MTRTRAHFTTAIAAGLLATAFVAASPALARDIGGAYRVAGTNLDGTAYAGSAEITVISDTTCLIEWETGSSSQGICMRHGGVLAAAYTLDGYYGLVVYDILADGTLRGTWTVAGENGAGTETLTPIR